MHKYCAICNCTNNTNNLQNLWLFSISNNPENLEFYRKYYLPVHATIILELLAHFFPYYYWGDTRCARDTDGQSKTLIAVSQSAKFRSLRTTDHKTGNFAIFRWLVDSKSLFLDSLHTSTSQCFAFLPMFWSRSVNKNVTCQYVNHKRILTSNEEFESWSLVAFCSASGRILGQ